PRPALALGLRHPPLALEELQHAQVVERVDVAGDHLRQRAHALAVARGRRHQRRLRPHLVQVLEDRQRLPQHALPLLQHRHQFLRVGLAEGVGVLLAAVAHQVHRDDLVRQPLQVEADAHPVRGAGAPVRIQAQPVAHGSGCRSIRCSIAPKMLLPSRSNISIRTWSPKDRNGVFGLPWSSVSTVRFSAKHEAPLDVSWLAFVPEQTMLPADRGRVLAACATSCAQSHCMSTPACGAPNPSPLTWVPSGRCSWLPRQASPSSSGVTNTGDSVERGLDCRKPKPLASSPGIRLRSETSLTRPTSWMCPAACSGLTAIGTSSVTTTISASRSMP